MNSFVPSTGSTRKNVEACGGTFPAATCSSATTGMPAAWACYATVEAARIGTDTLLRDDRVLRVMIVRNEVPPAFVEWAER